MAAPPPRPTPRPMAAGHAILVVVIALLVGTLLNARDIQATARRQPFGWQRNVAMAAITPVQALSAALGLDRPRTA
ncbi:MAG: hypothetical protein M3276_05905, partial [Actinomycetota bacterium]|nr:hypothetical protein [Actinomycetota bacterium]